MKLNILKQNNYNLSLEEVNIIIEYSEDNRQVRELEDYIKEFDKEYEIKFVNKNNDIVPINKNDIILFYSDKKNNYCKTFQNSYKIKSKLYEIEKMDRNYVRISKSCIANLKHIKKFDLNETGTIIVIFDDNTKEIVSRRRAREVLDYLSERRI